jgi:hypothetical protein
MDRFLNSDEQSALRTVPFLHDVTNIAIAVLNKMKETKLPVVMICSPISTGGLGSTEMNLARYKKAIEKAKEHGLVVFDILPFEAELPRIFRTYQGNHEADKFVYFEMPIYSGHKLTKALFLEDWPSSQGASHVRDMLNSFLVRVEDYPMEWLKE